MNFVPIASSQVSISAETAYFVSGSGLGTGRAVDERRVHHPPAASDACRAHAAGSAIR